MLTSRLQFWNSPAVNSPVMYFNSCCSCSFESKIIKIGQSSHEMYSNNILNVQESSAILNTCTKKGLKLIEGNTYVNIYRETSAEQNIIKKKKINKFISSVYWQNHRVDLNRSFFTFWPIILGECISSYIRYMTIDRKSIDEWNWFIMKITLLFSCS